MNFLTGSSILGPADRVPMSSEKLFGSVVFPSIATNRGLNNSADRALYLSAKVFLQQYQGPVEAACVCGRSVAPIVWGRGSCG